MGWAVYACYGGGAVVGAWPRLRLRAAPAERACTWCDFRPVCGPREEERITRKAADRLVRKQLQRRTGSYGDC